MGLEVFMVGYGGVVVGVVSWEEGSWDFVRVRVYIFNVFGILILEICRILLFCFFDFKKDVDFDVRRELMICVV